MSARVVAWARIGSGSTNRHGLDRMRGELMSWFTELGGEVSEVALPPARVVEADGTKHEVESAPAIRVRCRPDAPVRVALTGHYDTVFAAESPFRDVRYLDAERIQGPGVADMKGGLVVLGEALLALERSPWAKRLGWEVLISPDEETGSPGSKGELARLGAWAHVGMTYEPALADGSFAGARKGTAKLTLVARGRAAHAGRAHHLGRNAVAAAARFAVAVDALNGVRDGVTFNVACIEGGGPLNIVPELGICRFEVRSPSDADWQWAAAELDRLVGATGATEGISAELDGGVSRPPKPLCAQNLEFLEFVRTSGAAIDIDVRWRDTGGVCEGNNLWGAGCPNVDTLGVRGGGIHSEQEFIQVSSLVERSQLSALVLMRMANGAYDARRLRGVSR